MKCVRYATREGFRAAVQPGLDSIGNQATHVSGLLHTKPYVLSEASYMAAVIPASGSTPVLVGVCKKSSEDMFLCSIPEDPSDTTGFNEASLEAARMLADQVAACADFDLVGASGNKQLAAAFAERFVAKRGGLKVTVKMNMRLFENRRVLYPREGMTDGVHTWKPSGEYASTAMMDYGTAFITEVFGEAPPREVIEPLMRSRGEQGYFHVLSSGEAPAAGEGEESKGGEGDRHGDMLSMIAVSAMYPQGCRVGFVYTEPANRGKGYASTVTAQATQTLLDEGVPAVALYTDLANPTSNHIYQTVGYNVLFDASILKFKPLAEDGEGAESKPDAEDS